MEYTLEIKPLATIETIDAFDAFDAFDWYEVQKEGLGFEFLNALDIFYNDCRSILTLIPITPLLSFSFISSPLA